jgi:hypothetical protein
MPPQQPDGLLDLRNDGRDFRAHFSDQISGVGYLVSMHGSPLGANLIPDFQRLSAEISTSRWCRRV